jgi:DNA-binding NtrC family response regulator
VQILVARVVSERRAPWERATPLDISLAISATTLLEPLVEENRLASELAGRFEGVEPIVLPGLRDRAEDLRSIVADRLAREGLRVHGRPTGIDMAAFSLLVEYDFEAEDAELASIVTKLVARAKDDVVRAADVRALGLAIPEAEREEAAR